MKKLINNLLSLLLIFSVISSIIIPTNLVQAEETSATMEVMPTVQEAIDRTASFMMNTVSNPSFENEWYILSLARSNVDVPQSYYDTYFTNLENDVRAKNGILHKVKYTEYSRVILAVTAIGKDPRNVGGYDLVEKLFDLSNVTKQGINGPIFALIALDTNGYVIPNEAENSREKMIDYILGKQLADGGFALSGTKGDVDITAMALQALSNYQSQVAVKTATERAIEFLSVSQKETGGFASWGTVNVESAAQTLVALTSLGINPKTDARFIKGEGNWIVSNMMTFFNDSDGAFRHTLTTGSNSMATEQSAYALVSYNRLMSNQKKLYDMSDVSTGTQPVPPDPITPTEPIEEIVKTPVISREVTDQSTTLVGTTEPLAQVVARIGTSEIGRSIANSDGLFAINIVKQKAGTVITLKAEVEGKLTSELNSITVMDKTAPILTISEVSDKSTSVTGTTEPNAKMAMYINGKLNHTKTATSKGKYTFPLTKQKAGTVIQVIATDQAENKASFSITVIAKTPQVLTVNQINNLSTTVTGTTDAKAKMAMYINGKLNHTKTATSKGTYTFPLAKQKVGTTITIVASDQAGNKTTLSKTVVAPSILTINKVTNKSTKITGTTNPKAKMALYINGKLNHTKTATSKGSFTLPLAKQKVGATIKIVSTDQAGNSITLTKKVTK